MDKSSEGMSLRGTLKSKLSAEIDGGSLSLADGSEIFLLSSMLFGLLTWYSANVHTAITSGVRLFALLGIISMTSLLFLNLL